MGKTTAGPSVTASLEMYTRVLESMVEGVSVSDERGTIIYTNPAEDRMFGYEPGELRGQSVTTQNAYPPEENLALVTKVIDQLKATGSWTGEWLNRKKDGTVFRTYARITAIELEGRAYWVCVQEDITNRYRSEQRLRAFIEATSSVVWTTGPDGTIREPQPSWEAYTGQHWPAYQGAGALDAIHAEDRKRVLEAWRDGIAAARQIDLEYRLWHAGSGMYRYVRARGVPVTAAVGVVSEWVGTLTDVHESRLAEQQRREAVEKLRSLIEASPLPIVALTREGIVTLWNPAAERVFGWTEAEACGQTLPFIPKDKLDEHRAMRERDLAGEGFKNREIQRVRRDGSLIDLLVCTAPMRDASGHVAGIMSVYMDITERKRMEVELRETDAKFRALVEQSPISTQILSADGRTIATNAAWEKLWGVTKAEIADYNVFEDPQLADRGVLPFLLRARAGEAVQIPEALFIPDRGSRRGEHLWVRAAAYPVRDDSGRVSEVVLVHEDVTDRRRAENALRQSEERYRTLVSQSPVPIWEEDWSGAFAEMLDLERSGVDLRRYLEQNEDAIGQCLARVDILATNAASAKLAVLTGDTGSRRSLDRTIARESWPQVVDLLLALRNGSTSYRGECYLNTPGSAKCHVIFDLAVVPGHERTLDRVIVTLTDISERVRAEEALRRSENYFRQLADRAPAMLWLTEPDGSCTYLNQRWSEFTGVPFEQGLGFGWLETLHPDDRQAAADAFLSANARKEAFSIDCRIRRHDGSWRWAVDRGEPRFDEQGAFLGYIGTVLDIADRKLAEEALRASNEELRQANAELEEFAYVASHDLQEPLRNVKLYSQLLLRKHRAASDEETHRFTRYVEMGVERMEMLIHDLLAYSRSVHTLRDEAEPGRADLNHSVREALDVLDERIRSASATVTSEPLPVVRADPQQVSLVFQNLLSNAIKYAAADRPPEIRIAARQSDGCWIISVADNGIGFDQKYAERVFGLFKRLHREDYPGSGLGLAISKRITERFGGRIWAESKPGQGSTFYFELPAG